MADRTVDIDPASSRPRADARPGEVAFRRYAIAVLAVAAALGIKLILLRFGVSYPLSSSFLAAIGVAFWFGGTGPGLVAVVLSSLAFGLVVAPRQIELLEGESKFPSFLSILPYLIYFWLVALLMSWFSSSRRKAERLLNQARNELEHKVDERTADLSRANRELQAEVAERRRADVRLRETAELLDLTHDSVFVRDMNNVITYWNRGAEEQYGWSRQEAIGQVSHDLLGTIFPAREAEIHQNLLRTGRWDGELIHHRRDQSEVIAASRWAVQSDEQGAPLAILETNNDITARKQAEDALHNAQAELAHVTRVMTMGELVASIAHEVNQPLGAIVTNGHACLRLLAGESPQVERSREVIGRMIDDGMRASEVIRRIRELVHKAPSEREPMDINDTVREVTTLLSRDLAGSSLCMRSELAHGLPPVEGDRIQLQQVVLNLILNARDAISAAKSGPCDLLVTTSLNGSGQVLVAVRDTGVGLGGQDPDRIFDAFFTTKAEGMGLGLSISRTIIEAHGGTLWATPNEGAGTTVQFSLPPMGGGNA